MQRTKIEWTDYTWNPIKGVCPVGCWYCYARKMYERFGWKSEICLDSQDLLNPHKIKKPSKIFVCSTFELFNPITNIEYGWDHTDFGTMRDAIFDVIKSSPQHTFQILTKMPQNIDRPMPDNVWLGVSVTSDKDVWRIKELTEIPTKLRFVSIEPFLNPIYNSAEVLLKHMDWIIIGRLTGCGKKHDPKYTYIKGIEVFARNRNIPIFLKDNLKDIWGEDLIQEFPE